MSDPKDDDVDETGADAQERDAKDELFEAIDHFKNAASILFERATSDPTVKTATKEAEKVVRKVGDAAEPLATEFAKELGRLTKDVMSAVEGTTERVRKKRKKKRSADGEEEE